MRAETNSSNAARYGISVSQKAKTVFQRPSSTYTRPITVMIVGLKALERTSTCSTLGAEKLLLALAPSFCTLYHFCGHMNHYASAFVKTLRLLCSKVSLRNTAQYERLGLRTDCAVNWYWKNLHELIASRTRRSASTIMSNHLRVQQFRYLQCNFDCWVTLHWYW